MMWLYLGLFLSLVLQIQIEHTLDLEDFVSIKNSYLLTKMLIYFNLQQFYKKKL